ncbi:unnamed protein product [Urochloa humidicola]
MGLLSAVVRDCVIGLLIVSGVLIVGGLTADVTWRGRVWLRRRRGGAGAAAAAAAAAPPLVVRLAWYITPHAMVIVLAMSLHLGATRCMDQTERDAIDVVGMVVPHLVGFFVERVIVPLALAE